jgi:hypothetical protein
LEPHHHSSLWVHMVRAHLLGVAPQVPLPAPALVAEIAHDVSGAKYKRISGSLAAEVDAPFSLYIHPQNKQLQLKPIAPVPNALPVNERVTNQTAAALASACPGAWWVPT